MIGVLVLSLLLVTGIYLDLKRMRKAVHARDRRHECNCTHCFRKSSL